MHASDEQPPSTPQDSPSTGPRSGHDTPVAPAEPSDSASADARGDDEPCHVGFVFALSQEAGGLLDRLSGAIGIAGSEFTIQEGGLAGRRVAVVVAGPGRKAAARAAEILIAGHAPRRVVSAGFAGGLVDSIARGDIVVADEAVIPGGERIAVEAPPVLVADGVAPSPGARPAVHVGRVVTVDEIATMPAAKRALAEAHGAIAVDMESFAVAQVCAAAGTPFLSIRIVSDAVADTLPAEVANLMKQKSLSAKLGAVAGALFKRPSSIKDIYQLKEYALLASDRLARFLEGVLPRL